MNVLWGFLLFIPFQKCVHRDIVGVLDLANDNDAMEASDAVDVAEGVEHEILIVLHVVGINLDLEVIVARRVVTFRDLVNGLHGIHELLDEFMGMLLQSDVAEHNDVVSQSMMVHDRSISLDVSLSLQAFLTLKGGGGG